MNLKDLEGQTVTIIEVNSWRILLEISEGMPTNNFVLVTAKSTYDLNYPELVLEELKTKPMT